jgi:hypothetical protein
MVSFLTKPKTKSETSSSTLQVQFKEIPNEDVSQDEALSEVIAVLETNDYNSDIENIVEEVQHNLAFSLFFRHILFSSTICFFHQFLYL